MTRLTRAQHERDQRILEFIEDFTNWRGFPPTVREIAAFMGWRAYSNAAHHVHRLVNAGRLVQEKGKARSYSIPRRFSPREEREGVTAVPLLGTFPEYFDGAAAKAIKGATK